MALPKRKHSKRRTRTRKAQWKKISALPLVECPQCHELKVPHRICGDCGYYKKEVIGAEK